MNKSFEKWLKAQKTVDKEDYSHYYPVVSSALKICPMFQWYAVQVYKTKDYQIINKTRQLTDILGAIMAGAYKTGEQISDKAIDIFIYKYNYRNRR